MGARNISIWYNGRQRWIRCLGTNIRPPPARHAARNCINNVRHDRLWPNPIFHGRGRPSNESERASLATREPLYSGDVHSTYYGFEERGTYRSWPFRDWMVFRVLARNYFCMVCDPTAKDPGGAAGHLRCVGERSLLQRADYSAAPRGVCYGRNVGHEIRDVNIAGRSSVRGHRSYWHTPIRTGLADSVSEVASSLAPASPSSPPVTTSPRGRATAW